MAGPSEVTRRNCAGRAMRLVREHRGDVRSTDAEWAAIHVGGGQAG